MGQETNKWSYSVLYKQNYFYEWFWDGNESEALQNPTTDTVDGG